MLTRDQMKKIRGGVIAYQCCKPFGSCGVCQITLPTCQPSETVRPC